MPKIKLYTPHHGQRPLHASKARFRIATCGRRWGKTFACINEIAKHAWENPGAMTWWVSPTYRQSRIAFRLMLKEFKNCIKRYTQNPMEIHWINGSVSQFNSTDQADNLRGEGVQFMVVDEASMVPEDAWNETLRPTLTDKEGRAIIVSTPKGMNWFHRMYARGQDPDNENYESWQFPTHTNPYISKSEIQEVKNTLPSDVFKQEYLAQFLEDGGAVFRNIRSCVKGNFQDWRAGEDYVVAWDVAKHSDHSCLVCISATRGHVVAFDRFNRVDYTLQVKRAEAMARKYKAKMIVDSTGVGDPILEQVKQLGLQVEGFQFTNTSKQQLIEHLAVQIEQQAITFPNIPQLIHELEVYQYEITRAGNMRYNAPSGFNDDCVISLALAVWACNRSKEPRVRFL